MESNSAKRKRSNPHFGRDPIVIGNFYLHQNTWAGKPMHFLVKVRSAFVDEAGYVRVGCSHPGRSSEELVDEDGFCVEFSLTTFPHSLRAVSKEELPALYKEAVGDEASALTSVK